MKNESVKIAKENLLIMIKKDLKAMEKAYSGVRWAMNALEKISAIDELKEKLESAGIVFLEDGSWDFRAIVDKDKSPLSSKNAFMMNRLKMTVMWNSGK